MNVRPVGVVRHAVDNIVERFAGVGVQLAANVGLGYEDRLRGAAVLEAMVIEGFDERLVVGVRLGQRREPDSATTAPAAKIAAVMRDARKNMRPNLLVVSRGTIGGQRRRLRRVLTSGIYRKFLYGLRTGNLGGARWVSSRRSSSSASTGRIGVAVRSRHAVRFRRGWSSSVALPVPGSPL